MLWHLGFDLRRVRALALLTVLTCTAWLGRPSVALAQAAGVDLDVASLVTSSQVFEQNIIDPVWKLSPREGRALMWVPIVMEPGAERFEVNNTLLRVQGGRFIAWQVVDPAARELAPSDGGRETEPAVPTGPAASVESVFPDRAPTLTLRFEVLPDHSITWRLSPVPGGEVEQQGDLLYALRLDRNLMRAQDPNYVARPTPGSQRSAPSAPRRNENLTPEQRRAEAERLRAERDAQRETRAIYQQLQKTVADLPTDFVLPLPQRVWGIFEVRENATDHVIDLPGVPTWSFHQRDLEAARRLAEQSFRTEQPSSRRGSRDAATEPQAAEPLPPEVITDLQTLGDLVAAGHPFSARLAAQAIASSGALERTVLGDSTYRLVEAIVDSGDAVARRIIAGDFAQLVTPSDTTQRLVKHLLEASGDSLDTQTKMLALRALLNTDLNNPLQVDDMLHTTNRYLEEPQGPDPGAILTALVETVESHATAVQEVARSIEFDKLTPPRRDRAIVATLELAGRSALARQWLDMKLLGSPDEALAMRTLEVLGGSESASGGGVRDALSKAAGLLGLGKGGGSESLPIPPLTLESPIVIESAEHHVFHWLSHADAKVRALAWSGAKHLTLTAQDGARGARGGAPAPQRRRRGSREAGPDIEARRQDAHRQLYGAFVAAALSGQPTPPQAVELLARQDEPAYAGEALADLAAHARQDVAHQAAAAMIGKQFPLAEKMVLMNVDERYALAKAAYEQNQGHVPPIAGLIRERSESADVAVWFAEQLGAQGPPEAARWLPEALEDDQQYLFELIASSSDEELALGAAAALAATVGGDEASAAQVVARFLASNARRPAEMEKVWDEARHEILLGRVGQAAGRYRMRITVLNQQEFNFGTRPTVDEDRRGRGRRGGPEEQDTTAVEADLLSILGDPIDVGVVQLSADGSRVAFEGMSVALAVPDTFLAIRIARPTELKSIPSDAVAKLPLEVVDGPIHLMPQPDGSWRGQFQLGKYIGDITLVPEK